MGELIKRVIFLQEWILQQFFQPDATVIGQYLPRSGNKCRIDRAEGNNKKLDKEYKCFRHAKHKWVGSYVKKYWHGKWKRKQQYKAYIRAAFSWYLASRSTLIISLWHALLASGSASTSKQGLLTLIICNFVLGFRVQNRILTISIFSWFVLPEGT